MFNSLQGGTLAKGEAGHFHHHHQSSTGNPAALPMEPNLASISTGAHSHQGTVVDDAASEAAPSEYYGRVGSRLSMRQEGMWEVGTEDGGSQKGTLKGMFKKQKKSKQIELDALR